MKILLLGHGVANDGCSSLLNKYLINYDYLDINQINKDQISTYDYIVKSPGISLYDKVFNYLKGSIISDIGLGYLLLKPKIIGITGSNGKTSVSSMLYSVLKSKYKCVLCGNIGYSFCQALVDYEDVDFYIVEISSFQLENINFFDFYISGITNITLTHLDHHKTFSDYLSAKVNIFKYQSINNYFVYNSNNIYLKDYTKDLVSNKVTFSIDNILADVFLLNNKIYYKYKYIKDVSGIFNFRVENIMMCLAILSIFKFNLHKAIKILLNYKEEKYRLNKITDYIYNDAKSTNAKSTEKALENLKDVRLICGGYNRGIDIVLSSSALANLVKVYAYGETKDLIYKYMSENNIDVEVFNNLEEAYKKCSIERATNEIILYSPMYASFDQYDSYIKRGEEFNNLVSNSNK